uniref:tRNA pseudouridine(55) synthase n=1 Tax=Rodentolepis nana TaxID=102285 RepID=A0A0R3TU56_RODNA
LELSAYSRTLASMLRSQIDHCGDRVIDGNVIPDRANNLSWLADIVNKSTNGRVFVRDLQVVSAASSKAFLKDGDVEKRKRYRALCWCPDGGLTTEKIRLLDTRLRELTNQSTNSEGIQSNLQWPPTEAAFQTDLGAEVAYLSFGRFTIEQLTPIRVLHRRALMTRKRDIIWFRLADFTTNVLRSDAPFVLREFASQASVYPKEELFLLELCCDAGTYVKELVHGDLGRTQPSLSSLIGSQLDLISLDVIAVEQDWPPRIENALVKTKT